MAALRNWGSGRSDPSKYRVRSGPERLRYRESVIDGFDPMRAPPSISEDISAVFPCLVEIRRASSMKNRRGALVAEVHLPPRPDSKIFLGEAARRPKRIFRYCFLQRKREAPGPKPKKCGGVA